MATKKKIPVRKNPTKKSTEKKFVVKFHSYLNGAENNHESCVYWSERGKYWVHDIQDATHYHGEGEADKKMLELLKEDKIASELVDLNVKPDNIFTLHTVFLDDGNIPQIITKVPQFPGDTYCLIPSNENIKEEHLVDVLRHNDFSILWDPEKSEVPEDTESWLYELIGEPCVE